MKQHNKSQKGFIALSIVLVVSAIVLVIIQSVGLLSIGEGQASYALTEGESSLNLVEGCAEDYLLKIRSDSTFAGGDVTRPEGTCTITITSGNPSWNVTVTTTEPDYRRSLQLTFIRSTSGSNAGITITSWKEN